MAPVLRFAPLGFSAVHLCIDMRTQFAERTEWHDPWLERILRIVVQLAEVPPPTAACSHVSSRQNGRRKPSAGESLNPLLIELVPLLSVKGALCSASDEFHDAMLRQIPANWPVQ